MKGFYKALKIPKVIYEDNHLLLVDKPSGWLVQGDKTGDKTLTDWGRAYIKEKYKKPGAVFLHPTHRIDRPVSGLILFARTSKALERLNKMFREDKMEKSYLAIVQGTPPSPNGKLIHHLLKDSEKNTTKAFTKEKKGAKYSELDYHLMAEANGYSLLQIFPKTGRPHQIRVQLSTMGNPIMGDLKYNYPSPNDDRSISLHAYKLSFVHPVKKTIVEFQSLPEGNHWDLFKAIINDLDNTP